MTMTRRTNAPVDERRHQYHTPTLIEVGDASDLILGIVGGGFDGDFGMTEPQFEFEADDETVG